MSAQDIKAAALAGRAAKPGAANPYAGGDEKLAHAWRVGYKTMLGEMMDESPAYQRYLAAQ